MITAVIQSSFLDFGYWSKHDGNNDTMQISKQILNKDDVKKAIDYLQNKTIFVDFAREDKDMANNCTKSLQDMKFTHLTSQKKTLNALTDKLGSCDIVVMFYDQAPASWMKARLRYYQVVRVKRDKPMYIFVFSQQHKPKDLSKKILWKEFTTPKNFFNTIYEIVKNG